MSKADYLFKNGTLSNNESDSLLSYNFNVSYGGADMVSKPNGGFPPLFECDTNNGETNDETKKKKGQAALVPISKILERRRGKTPVVPDISPVAPEASYNTNSFVKKSKRKRKSKK